MSTRRTMAALAATIIVAVPSAAYAASATDVQANNPQVPGNSHAVFPTNKQNEPTIAVDPMNPSRLIAGSNDEQLQPPCGPGPVRGADAAANDCSFFPNVGTDGVYTSSDGGASWTNQGLLPGFSDDGGSLVSDGDPVIVYGPQPLAGGGFSTTDYRAYYAGLASYASGAAAGHQAPELLSVSTSDDDGATWSDPVVAANGHGYTFNDKEAIWADRNPASPYFGRVYVSWTQFRGTPGCAEPIMFASSADGGQHWSRPRQLTAARNCGLGGRQGSTIRTGPDGTVYVGYEGSDQAGSVQSVVVSHDGGRRFGRPIRVAHLTDDASPIPGANFRTDSFASMAVDQNNGTVYMAWSDAGGGTGRLVVANSDDQGASWSAPVTASTAAEGYAFFQGLDVAPNGRVDLGYQALTAKDTSDYGTGNASIDSWYVSSSDHGATWTAPAKVSSASSDPAASAQNDLQGQFWGDYNTLVSSDDTAWFIYTDSRNGAGCPAVDAYQHDTSTGAPAPEEKCDPAFGNTDVYVSRITP